MESDRFLIRLKSYAYNIIAKGLEFYSLVLYVHFPSFRFLYFRNFISSMFVPKKNCAIRHKSIYAIIMRATFYCGMRATGATASLRFYVMLVQFRESLVASRKLPQRQPTTLHKTPTLTTEAACCCRPNTVQQRRPTVPSRLPSCVLHPGQP